MNYLSRLTGKKDKETKESKESKTTCTCSEVAGTFFFSRNQAHFWHLVTESYAEHKALNKYYDSIIYLLDNFIESYQGSHGKMSKPVAFGEFLDYSPEAVRNHFKELENKCEEFKNKLSETDGHLINILDEIKALVTKTTYLLTLS